MIKFCSAAAAIVLAGASLTGCGTMEGGGGKAEPTMSQFGGQQPSVQVLEDQRCGMAAQQGFVGRAVNSLPANVAATAKIIASNAPTPTDFTPTRLTIVFNPTTNVITQVKCG